ncbi:MAG TPA: hypothetical protein P5555_09065 [Candidatus Paceibacterota bacterium]|nr:hypothetical protein [Verrucomicrobiota bacterium]HRZ45325.1 hypothetical protein [Candidatus Paceibacterota bacterium]HRZ91532.1 hypothetical protein [Candidatus Paceibacterota bacterium]
MRAGPFILIVWLAWMLPGSGAAGSDFDAQLGDLQARLAGDPTNRALLFELGDLCHDEGALENAEAVRMAERYFRRLLDLESEHALGRALYGSVLTMRARDTTWPPTRLSLVKAGIREMDAAVARAPLDPRVRLVRADNNIHMPAFLDRKELVAADLAWLWRQAVEPAGVLSAPQRQRIALHHGSLLEKERRLADALAVWRRGISFDPASAAARQIQAMADARDPLAPSSSVP